MTALQLIRPADVHGFESAAGAFLAAREAEHNLILGLCSNLRTRTYGPAPPYFAAVRREDRVVAAALRTPPFQAVLSTIDDPGALPLLVDDLLETYPDLSGVLARKEDARGFCALWQERTGATYRLKTAERIFRCIRVIPARPVGGELRRADPAERDLIVEWLIAFTLEALGPDEDVSTVASIADHWLGGAGRWLYIWDDGGPVSMAGASGETPSGIRIGAVYTPPELRGRGYASNCVAAVSQAQLDRGRRFCFLFTDLANPTSNKIYHAIGYEPVCDVDEYRFEPGRV